MIYLDYSATTPINTEVLESFNTVSKEYYGNPNSTHQLGVKSKELIKEATKQIADLLHIKDNEIIYTSSATEANNIALINYCLANEKIGKHLIISKLEHPSVYNIVDYLETKGFKIDYVNNLPDGLINLEDLKKLIKKDTILVSVCGVNSEVGIRQPLKLIRQVIKKENIHTVFHSDLTQAIGKVSVNLSDVDLATFSAHKFYGPLGLGILYKNEKVKINPFVIGSDKDVIVNGTPATPLIIASSKALRITLEEINKKEEYIKKINEKICNVFLKYEDLTINKTKFSIPHILNISLSKIKSEIFSQALEKEEIYVSSNTTGKISTAVFALTNNRKLASSTIRISLSHITTNEEINKFLLSFDKIYKELLESNEN